MDNAVDNLNLKRSNTTCIHELRALATLIENSPRDDDMSNAAISTRLTIDRLAQQLVLNIGKYHSIGVALRAMMELSAREQEARDLIDSTIPETNIWFDLLEYAKLRSQHVAQAAADGNLYLAQAKEARAKVAELEFTVERLRAELDRRPRSIRIIDMGD